MSNFNAKRARSKRPCPLWVDAFQRDTQHLSTDEVGAYMLVLMAMWVRESCDLPDDDRRLAAVSRVSPRLWKSRVGPSVREFFEVEEGKLVSRRLQREADYVERHCKAQSDKRNANKSVKALKNNNPPPTVVSSSVATADMSSAQPTQQPNNPTNTIPSGMDDNAVDARELVWSSGKNWLVSQNVDDRQARSMIGKWLKVNSASDLWAAMNAARQAKTCDPIPYITAILSETTQPAISELMAKAAEVNAKR